MTALRTLILAALIFGAGVTSTACAPEQECYGDSNGDGWQICKYGDQYLDCPVYGGDCYHH